MKRPDRGSVLHENHMFKGGPTRILIKIIRMYLRQEGLCHYCRVRMTLHEGDTDRSATRDHRVPRSKGGNGFTGNVVLACLRCNRLKADMREADFVEMLELAEATPDGQ